MDKIRTIDEAASYIKDGMTVAVGGFIGAGTPEKLIDAVIAKGIKDLTLICNDTAFPDKGVGKWVVNRVVSRIIVSHIGTNPETGRQMNAGELKVELVPQGTLAERVRAAGAGLGGILTRTGIGTVVEEGKEKITVNGIEYLLELPLKADVALLKGSIVDKKGNIYYKKATRNFNPLMATAADLVIVEAEKIVEVGELDPTDVMTPSIFVDVITQ
ncbi:MAG TPA: 3-oxoacid CoA-transferase subunit A [Bacillota bacterium]|nr:3-oxoacid CoA-transferase subunit A [Bacillota bacterium]HRS20547.1 3-oxoacid CoA-transferase subunit A [Clostridia bacterium]HRU40806.1 3-oxoacid CoA-transferase subunit A [Candidatus Diapherotrites archaeon]HQE65669.1 3-oxoacid CoA-transferase subunit A [Bacillota bacterium]HQJ36508.1 3-oxoacid CoA-transferase subunit A [Bacillota bacterium]